MSASRRDFLKRSGLSAHGLTGVLPAPAKTLGQEALRAGRWGLAIFTSALNGAALEQIIQACHRAHNVPDLPEEKHAIKWIRRANFRQSFTQAPPHNAGTLEARSYLLLCNHCERPACVRVCPTGATFKRPDGIVAMDYHRCIGCRFCMAACPYGARSFNFQDPRPYLNQITGAFPTRMQGVVEKCNFCAERLDLGLPPHCVEAAQGAMLFGDLLAPDSKISQALKKNPALTRKPWLGAGPGVYYLL